MLQYQMYLNPIETCFRIILQVWLIIFLICVYIHLIIENFHLLSLINLFYCSIVVYLIYLLLFLNSTFAFKISFALVCKEFHNEYFTEYRLDILLLMNLVMFVFNIHLVSQIDYEINQFLYLLPILYCHPLFKNKILNFINFYLGLVLDLWKYQIILYLLV